MGWRKTLLQFAKRKRKREMREKVITKGKYDYIVREDGRLFLPKREFEFYRYGKLVRSSKPARESNYNLLPNGYLKCALGLVHRAVAEAFLEPPLHPSYTVNHKDGNKTNNHYTNLEWIPHSENVKHWIYSDRGIGKKTHPIEAFDLEGNSKGVFPSKAKAARDLGLHKACVTDVINGKQRQTGGYTFKEITKEEYYAQRNS